MIEGGRINRISVAVLVDGAYTKNEKGEPVYQERPKGGVDRITALVRSAIGYDQKRGDWSRSTFFAECRPTRSSRLAPGRCQFTKDDIMRGRSRRHVAAHRGVAPGRPPAGAPHHHPDKAVQAEEPARRCRSLRSVPQISEGPPIQAKPSQTTKMIEIAQVVGHVHAQSVQKVGELAERNPNETASILRQWLHEPA